MILDLTIQLLKRFKKFSESSTQLDYLKFGIFDFRYNEISLFNKNKSCISQFNHDTIKPFSYTKAWTDEEDLMSMLVPNLNADLEKRKQAHHKWNFPFGDFKGAKDFKKLKRNFNKSKVENERQAAINRAATGETYHYNMNYDT